MYIVAGLGNPGLKYRHTRHNTGFDAIDTMAKALGCDVKKDECRAKTGSTVIAGQKVLLVKPQTFMNLSGESLQALCAYYKVNPEEGLIVISDDIALPAGKIRIRAKGSAGGHNGLKDIIKNCGTENFVRLRIGVGTLPAGQDMISFVLGRESKDDRRAVEEAFEKCLPAVETIIMQGTEKAMCAFNG